jgi:hypothetical protein
MHGQIIKKDTSETKYIIGLYPHLFYMDMLIDDQHGDYARMLSCELEPYAGLNLYRNLYGGINFSYEFFFSNFYKKENFIKAGVFSRYILPFTLDKGLLKRIHLYFEIGYYKTNYKVVSYIANTFEYEGIKIEEDFFTSKGMNHSMVSIPIGITFHVSKGIYFDFNWRKNMYTNGTNENGFSLGLGTSLYK